MDVSLFDFNYKVVRLRALSRAIALFSGSVLVVLACFTDYAFAQLKVHLRPPPVGSMQIQNLWDVQFTNSGPATEIVLYGTAWTKSGHLVASGLTSPFNVPKGFSTVDASAVSPITYSGDQSYQEIILETGKVPPGEYTFCVTAIDAKTRDTLSRDCLSDRIVVNVASPQLIAPRNESTVQLPLPTFVWTPISPAIPVIDVTYRLKIAERVGRQSPIDAISSNPVLFESDALESTILQYPVSAVPFEDGTTYAWEVIAYATTPDKEQGEIGRSAVWTFQLPERIDTSIADTTRDDSQTSRGIDSTSMTTATGTRTDATQQNWVRQKNKEQESISSNRSTKLNPSTGVGPSQMNSSCGSLAVQITSVEGGRGYNIDVVNNGSQDSNTEKSGNSVAGKPRAFRIEVFGDTITYLKGNAHGLKYKPSYSERVISWSSDSGKFPTGKSNLGVVGLRTGQNHPIKMKWSWLDDSNKSLCTDSIVRSGAYYVGLKSLDDGTVYPIDDSLRFVLDNEYGFTGISCYFITENTPERTPHVTKFRALPGRNYYSLNTSKLKSQELQKLIVLTDNGKRLQCRFVKYQ